MAKGFSFEEVMRPLEPAKPVKGFSFAEVMRPVAEPEPAEVPTITSPEEIAPPQLAETRRPAVTPPAAPVAAPTEAPPQAAPATFAGEFGKGVKGAVEYGLPSMVRQIQLQGSASAMMARQNQIALMDQIDQGQFKSLTDLKNDPRYQALRKEGLDVGTVNAYFANRNLPQVNAKLRGKTAEEMVKLAGDTAGHIQTLNQYARENKAKYGPRVEKFTDINWTDPRVVADFTDWLGYNMGAGAVQMAPIMLAAVVTKQPGLLAVSGGMGVSEAVGNRLKFIQNQVKDLPPNKQGEAIAKYIADTGDVNLITGLVSGSFDLLLGPAAKAAKGFLPKEVGKVAAAKTAAKELPKDVASEAVTGALQQTVQIAAAKKLQEEGRAVTPENILDVINSAAAEAAGAPVGTAVNVGMAALQAPADPASQLARAIEEDAQRAAATPSALRMRSALEEAQAPSQARGFTFEEVTAPPAAPVVPPAAPRVEPAVEPPEEPAVAPAEAISAPAPTPAIEVIPGMPTGEELAAPPQETVTPVTVSEAPVQPTQAAAALPDTPVVPPVTKPKAFEPTAPQHATQGLPIQEVPLSDLRLSKDVPQFKIGASEKGVVEPLGGKFERTGIAPIQVWRRLDGSLEIISGRHRFDLAQRSGEKTIPAQIHDESKGFDKVQAAILDAELNIRDGQGKVKDYVNYFKESGIDREAADAKGLLARATGKRSFTIANQGSDELVAAVRADQIGDEAAYYVALNAPNDARLQGVGIKAIMDGKSMNTAVNTMQAVKALAGENDTTTDMFGFDDSAMREAEEMAKLAAQKQREIQTRLSAISGAAKNPAVAKAEGIDIRDPEAVKRRIDELRQLKSAWDNWSTSPELIAEIRQARGVAAPALTPVLQTQTPEELRQKAEREAAATRREEEEKRKAEQKAKADEEREEFVLTGSDRPADEAAARGQADIFAAPPAEEAVVDKYVSKLDEQKKTESYETTDDVLVKTETSEWQGTISRKEFDDLVAAASASPQQRGNKYAINVVDTKDASAILTFTARGLTPTQQRVEVSMQLQRSQVMEGAVEPGVAVDENDPGFLGASDKEVKDVAKAFDQYADAQEDEQNTRVFDAPAKSDIVRIEEKARREGVLTIAEAKKRIAEWKKNARAQGETGANSDKVVLSLFDATGEWSKPWEEAGYQVFRFDIQTDPEMGDVNKFSASFFNDLFGAFDGQDIYAVLAACPCTDFAASGARHFAAKDESGKTVESVQLVKQTLATIEYFKPSVWAIENPVGRIEKLTGLPPWRLSFNPNHFGDPYTKKTLLWGRFNADLPVAPVVPTEGSKMHRMYGGKSQETKNARSVTPEGFAYAFFQANNAVDNPVLAVANKYDMLDRKVVEQAVKAGLTEQEIADAVDEPYYMELDYKAANDALKAAAEAKQAKPEAPKVKGVGAAVMGERMVNAADRFRKAAMSQHKLTQEQADVAMGVLIQQKVLILDPVTGQFELKDGRFWNRDVLLRAAKEGGKPFTMLENIEPTAKKLPPGRSPELAAAAQRLQRGEITAKEFDELVNKYKPIPVYFAPLRPATSEEVYNALDSAKREKIDPPIREGASVGLRLDIPAFNRHGVFVVSIHEKRTPSAPGKVIGYSSVASIKNVTFGVGNQKEALKIAAGAAKDAIQTMEGQYVPITPEQAYQIADDAILSGDWVQVGFDPTRHSYFFDRSTTQPIVAADEVIQIGNMILAKGVKYAPKDSFLYSIDQGDLFSDNDAAAWRGDKTSAAPVKRGRSPEIAEAAERLSRGEITKEQFDEVVRQFSPVRVYAAPPEPPTDKQVTDALDANKRQYANVDVPTGTRVGLRLDIPAYERRNTWVVAIHQPKPTLTSPKASAILSYRSVAGLRNVTFGLGDQSRSLRIAAGEFKDKLQTMEGEYVDMTPQEAYARAQELINDPNYIQIGFNPLRHSYFYDRSTMQPVVSADEVLQIGNFILAKGVTYGRKEDFLYSAPDGDAAIREAIEKEKAEEIRAKQIQEYTELRAKIARITAKVAKGEVSLEMQQNLARAMQASRELQVAIRTSVPRADTAEDFLHKALTEYKAKNISYDVLEVIQDIYNKRPELLSGLVLRVRKGKGRAAGAFDPFERMVFLYKGTSGIENPSTIRHEITHSLEQMMSDKQRIAVVQAWGKALQRAIKQNPDEVNQKYFQAVLDFVDNPSELTFATAISLMPSNDMYQYINPSEFWAVNAEKLLASELGSAWDKFKRFAKGMLEGLKNIFGFDNRYAIHKTFSQVMSGSKERLNKSSLAQFVQSTGGDFTLLRSIEDEKDLLEKYNRPKTPMLDQSPIRTFLTRQFKNGKEFFESALKNPREAMVGSGNFVMDGLIYLRNKNVWYGSGLEARDFAQYNGQMRTSEGIVTASVALDNAIRSGNIGVEVIFRGGIKYDPKSGTFVATQTEKGMRGVYEAEAALKRRLGDQLGTDIIQGYLEAKRSISIMNELYDREAALEAAKEQLRVLRESGADPGDIAVAKDLVGTMEKEVESIRKAASSVNMSQPEMDEFAALDEKHPELRDIMDNWTAINQNLLRFWRQVGLLSQGRYERLAAIKDYVPWYRIMSDELDLHDSDQSAVQSTTRSMTNIGREKLFKRGKPVSMVDFRAKAGQQDFKIQPSSVVQVEVNGKKVSPDLVTATPDGNVRIDMPLEENDLVVFKTNREIQNIIDNMTRNVMRMTMNGIRQYAANRIVMEYASRTADNKIMVFPRVDKDKGRFNWIVNGKTVVVEIQDPLVASSIYGMENLNLQMWRPLAAVANLTRRSITLSGAFQIKQVFKDAPTAAMVTGVKNPAALIGGAWKGFLTSLTNTDPVVDILKAAGIGGYLSPARTPEAELKRRLGIMNRNVFSAIIKGLDHIGDSSDMAQRVATYKRVMAETGDEAQALFQAANVINFLHHGSAGYAQAVVKTVPFLGAYMNATDVLIRALVGGGLKGMSRKKALARLAVTTSFLVSLTILYAMLAGADPEYDELDDQTKLRNIIIPGTKIMLPMNTSAAFFYKAIPELIYNEVTRRGTENEMDRRRVRAALADAARDMLLGPEPAPAGIKQLFEVAINHDFFTGRPVIPEGLKNVDAAEQYTGRTSELGKKISEMLAIPGTDGKRVLSPIEADHIVRGVFGSAGAMAQWVSNSIGAIAEQRPEPTPRETPITGGFLREEVPRGREDLFYDLKDAVGKKYNTWSKLIQREAYDEATAYLQKHGDVAMMQEYVNEVEEELKEINAEIRRLEETKSTTMSPKERREQIDNYKRLKQEAVLASVKMIRRLTFNRDEEEEK